MARIIAASIIAAPSKNGIPGKMNGALFPVNHEKRLFIIRGPRNDVILMRLVSAPCSSPCALSGTWLDIMPCNTGPQMPPRQ